MEAQPRTVAGGELRQLPLPSFFFVLLCKRATVLTKFPAQKVIEHLEVTKKQAVELRLSATVLPPCSFWCYAAQGTAAAWLSPCAAGGPRIALRCRCHHGAVSSPAVAALLAATEQARKSLA